MKGYRLKSATEKGALGSLWKIQCKLQVIFSQGNRPSGDMWQHVWSSASQTSLPKPWHPGLALGIDHTDMADCPCG